MLPLASSNQPEPTPSLISSSLLGGPWCFPGTPSTWGISSNCPQLSFLELSVFLTLATTPGIQQVLRKCMLQARTPKCRARAPSTQAGGSSHVVPPSLMWKAPSHEERRCRAGAASRPSGLSRDPWPEWERWAGGEGRGPRSVLQHPPRKEGPQGPTHPSLASPPSRHLGLESRCAAPAWTSRSCGAGPGRGTLRFEEEQNKEPQKAKPPMSALSGPEPGYKWCSQGGGIHTAGIWGGVPVGVALSPTPVPRLLCRRDLRLDSQSH